MRGARTLGASAAVGASQNVPRVDATTRVTETEARAGGAVAGSSRSSPLLRLGGAEELLLEPDRLLDHAALEVGQLRVEQVDVEDDAVLRGRVEGLVLEGRVKHHHLPLAPVVLFARNRDVGRLAALLPRRANHPDMAGDHPAARVDVARQPRPRTLPLERDSLAREAKLAQRAHRLRTLLRRKGRLPLAAVVDWHRPPPERLADVLKLRLARQ
mmetsp:Transcript_31424/g.92749  ORF Transcript_31424/g.92749 Transcript_31424/m.92749 type:complete len:214 (-) Transcript_31424:217-858(-)